MPLKILVFRGFFIQEMVMRRRFFQFATLFIAACAICTAAVAQNDTKNGVAWPTKTVHIIVGFPAGSSPDLTARTLAEPLAKALGQAVIVENKVGAGGNIALIHISE